MEIIKGDRGANAAKTNEDGSRHDYRVDGAPGLQLRVMKDTKRWSFLYRSPLDGKQKRLSLGLYPAVRLADAKTAANDARNKVSHGIDPAAVEDKGAQTFEELAEKWITRHAKVKKRSWSDDVRRLKADVYPAIGKVNVNAVTRLSITNLVEKISDRGACIQANRVLTLINTIFNWGVRRGEISNNPAHGLEKPSTEKARTRVVDHAELKQLWALDDDRLSSQMKIILRLSLLLGQRVNELAMARKSEFNLAAKRWDIPGVRKMPDQRKETGTKNKLDHPLPLSNKAVELVREAFVLSDNGEWLFPSTVRKDRPNCDTWASHAWGAARKRLGLGDLNIHDIRRSFGTIAGECGYTHEEVGIVLNHVSERKGSSVTRRYVLADYFPEKERLIKAVERRLFEIIEPASLENSRRPRVFTSSFHRTGTT